jgi:hypothetical protein
MLPLLTKQCLSPLLLLTNCNHSHSIRRNPARRRNNDRGRRRSNLDVGRDALHSGNANGGRNDTAPVACRLPSQERHHSRYSPDICRWAATWLEWVRQRRDRLHRLQQERSSLGYARAFPLIAHEAIATRRSLSSGPVCHLNDLLGLRNKRIY